MKKLLACLTLLAAPLAAQEPIPQGDAKRFSFCDGAEKLKDPINDRIFYTNLTVETELLQQQYDMESSFHTD